MKHSIEAFNRAIEILGGVGNMTLLISNARHEPVTRQTVYLYRKTADSNGRGALSPVDCVAIEQATNGEVSRMDLYPTTTTRGSGLSWPSHWTQSNFFAQNSHP